MRLKVVGTSLVLTLAPALAAQAAEPVPGFDEAAAALHKGLPVPALQPKAEHLRALNALASDPRASVFRRAMALAAVGETTSKDRRTVVRMFLQKAAGYKLDRLPRRPPPWTSIYVSGLQWAAQQVPEARLRPGDVSTLARLLWTKEPGVLDAPKGREPSRRYVPKPIGRAARAMVALGMIDDPRAAIVVLTAATAPGSRLREAQEAAMALLAMRPNLQDALLAGLASLPEGDSRRLRLHRVLLRNSRAPKIVGPTLAFLKRQTGALSPDAVDLIAGLHRAPQKQYAPELARIVEKHPHHLARFAAALIATQAPVSRKLLWSRLGHPDQRAAIQLLGGGLREADAEPLVACLAEARWGERNFYLRLDLARHAPAVLRTPALRAALWRVARGKHQNLRVAREGAIESLGRFGDRKDDAALDVYVGLGPHVDARYRALRILVKRNRDPESALARYLDHEDPKRRFTASYLIRVLNYRPSFPVTPKGCDKLVRILSRRLPAEEDPALRFSQLQALDRLTRDFFGGGLHPRTAEQKAALVSLYAKLYRSKPPVRERLQILENLRRVRTEAARAEVARYLKDPDKRVASTANLIEQELRAGLEAERKRR